MTLRTPLAVALLFCCTALAGCSSGAKTSFEVTISSTLGPGTQTVGAPSTAPPGSGKGHIAGIVVNSGINPLEGAKVKLPTIDLEDDSDRDGAFSFVDLAPGAYLVRAELKGYDMAETLVQVREGEFTRIKFVLHLIPPPTPKVEVQKFKGMIGNSYPLLYSCSQCSWYLHLKQPGVRAGIADMVFDNPSQNRFSYTLYNAQNTSIESKTLSQPAQAYWTASRILNWTDTVQLRVLVGGATVPESNVSYQVFVSVWRNVDPPVGWTFPKDGNPYP